MPNQATNVTVPGTTRPWNFAAITAAAGGNTVQVGYNANLQDGSSGGGGVGQNIGFTFGQQHVSPAGETAPITVAVTPGALISVKYLSGTVAAFSGGTNYTPIGDTSATSGLSPTVDFTDTSGYVYPTNCMPASKNLSLTNPTIGRVGLCGCFTDSSGNIIANSFWDWKSKGGTSSANSSIGMVAPAGAAFISMGINDTILRDNTGSFSLTVFEWDDTFLEAPTSLTNQNWFVQYPMWSGAAGTIMDVTAVKPLIFYRSIPSLYLADLTDAQGVFAGYWGQLYPHGAQNLGGIPSGTQGQNFPY